jgi:FHA domain
VDTSETKAAALLIDDLQELRSRAGNPSLGELVKFSQNKMSKSTLNAYLSRRRVSLPRWRLVSAYVVACHAAAESTGLDLGKLGTLDEWHARWTAAMKGDCEAASPLRESPTTKDLDDLDVNAAVSAGPILWRLEKDLLRLQESLSAYDGLLMVISGPRFGWLYEVKHEITTIGRDLRCDIWLNESTVSRRHAEIYCYGDKFTLRDLESKNGTYRRNIRIKESLLRSYDELNMGSLRLLFIQGGDERDRFQSHRYDSVRSHLIQDSVADTSSIYPMS